MLPIIKKYKFSLFLATAFHVMLFSFIFMNWQPEQKQSKKIVLKQGDVIQATAISTAQFNDKIKEIKDKAIRERKQKKEKKLAAQKKKREQARIKEKKRKALVKKKAEEKKRKVLAKKKTEEKKRKTLAKKQADKKKKLKREKELKKKKEEKRKKEAEAKKRKEEKRKKEKAKAQKLKREKLKQLQKKKQQERKAEEKRRQQAEKKRQQEIAVESARLEADRVRREKGIVNRYAGLIQNKIKRYWRRPANVETKMKCTLNIRMTPNGEVISVKVTRGSGNFAFDRAAEKAVNGASPLPVPTDRTIFDKDFRNLTINYEK